MRWRDYSIVMQSAMNALNPMKSIGAQFRDALEAHAKASHEEIRQRSAEVMSLVGIDPVHLDSYPHQLSGGMRQRAMIAMALLFTPQLVIMDEPTSALDVVAQRSLMTKVKELQQKLGFAVIFVTHDMSVVSRYSDRVMVMYAGQIAEAARTDAIFERPLHPYSRGLMARFRRSAARDESWWDPRSAPGPRPAAARLPFQPALPARSCRRARRDEPSCIRSARPRCGVCCTTEQRRRRSERCPRSREQPAAGRRATAADGRPDAALPPRRDVLNKQVLHAVDDFNVTIAEREIVALVGESGSGKSTVARLLARLYPDPGRNPLSRPAGAEAALPQGHALVPRRGCDRPSRTRSAPFNPVFRISHGVMRNLALHQPELSRDERRRRPSACARASG